jgi:hypothetical protein
MAVPVDEQKGVLDQIVCLGDVPEDPERYLPD